MKVYSDERIAKMVCQRLSKAKGAHRMQPVSGGWIVIPNDYLYMEAGEITEPLEVEIKVPTIGQQGPPTPIVTKNGEVPHVYSEVVNPEYIGKLYGMGFDKFALSFADDKIDLVVKGLNAWMPNYKFDWAKSSALKAYEITATLEGTVGCKVLLEYEYVNMSGSSDLTKAAKHKFEILFPDMENTQNEQLEQLSATAKEIQQALLTPKTKMPKPLVDFFKIASKKGDPSF